MAVGAGGARLNQTQDRELDWVMPTGLGLQQVLSTWWRESVAQHGKAATFRGLLSKISEFLWESLPAQRRQRYGDAEYDWEYRADTTSGTVGWRDRLLGKFSSPYQPTEPALFHRMISSLPCDLRPFFFIDIGSGKGRTLLMASGYPFRGIIGLELLPSLAAVAQANVKAYQSSSQQCFAFQVLCGDAREFDFPDEPLVLYLFNPLPEAPLRTMLRRLGQSLASHPRPVLVIYHNPLLATVLQDSGFLTRLEEHLEYSVWTNHPQSP